MAFNPTFYNRNYTFHGHFVPQPPPPPPPKYYLPPPTMITDEEFVSKFDNIPNETKKFKPAESITDVKERIRKLLIILDELKSKEESLTGNLEALTEDKWKSNVQQIEENKSKIAEIMAQLNDSCLQNMRKLLAKRAAKRSRLQRCRVQRRMEKEEIAKERRERSRKIDEYLQKIKDDIAKANQEEAFERSAAAAARGTARRRAEARRAAAALRALARLHAARQHTARARGQPPHPQRAAEFHATVEKLEYLWERKLVEYEREESELRGRLRLTTAAAAGGAEAPGAEAAAVQEGTRRWEALLFGGAPPQVDFAGDVHRFLNVRAQWDGYSAAAGEAGEEGEALPVGWVLPPHTS